LSKHLLALNFLIRIVVNIFSVYKHHLPPLQSHLPLFLLGATQIANVFASFFHISGEHPTICVCVYVCIYSSGCVCVCVCARLCREHNYILCAVTFGAPAASNNDKKPRTQFSTSFAPVSFIALHIHTYI